MKIEQLFDFQHNPIIYDIGPREVSATLINTNRQHRLYQHYFCPTRVAALLDALPPVRDASSRVSGVDDVALVARGAVKRLISIFSGAAGLS